VTSHRLDRLIGTFDAALRTLFNASMSARPYPAAGVADSTLTSTERRHAAGLMRVNHTGEVCAQALYEAQALAARDVETRARLQQAAREEQDHLAWTTQRLSELGSRTSVVNPLWYAGSFAIGLAAGLAGDRTSMGFVVETERQVEEHLTGHMDSLPHPDGRSRSVVAAMRDDEVRHGMAARDAGASELPLPLKLLMRTAAKIMTLTAYRI
jgi:3-demethoxyubiquinol 3-hydroxylase